MYPTQACSSVTIKSWIEFIAEDYKQKRSIEIDVEKLLNEIKNR